MAWPKPNSARGAPQATASHTTWTGSASTRRRRTTSREICPTRFPAIPERRLASKRACSSARSAWLTVMTTDAARTSTRCILRSSSPTRQAPSERRYFQLCQQQVSVPSSDSSPWVRA
jgi:hypothetical protein